MHVLAGAVLVLSAAASAASQYSSSGVRGAQYLTLDNGLRVVLKPRSGARTVSMRLAVDVGHWDFPCGRQQTAHFLEHLLFTGTTDHEEMELDTLIESHGGTWNATTRREETVYEIDIFSRYADIALNTLFEIMSKSEISEEDVFTSRLIVQREMGGRPTATRRWLYSLGLGKSAWSNMWETLGAGSNAACPYIETADDITRQNLLDAYKTYYVPGNMVLVVVGDFRASHMFKRIQATFGELPPGENPLRKPLKLVSTDDRFVAESHFSPILDSDAFVILAFQVPDSTSTDQHALRVLQAYLHKRIYEVLRVNGGLAYSPGAFEFSMRRFGLMAAYADVYVENMDRAVEAMQVQIDYIIKGQLKDDDVDKVKQKLLLAEATQYERNSNIAEYYVGMRHVASSNGGFRSRSEGIAKVTAGDLVRVAKQYMRKEQGFVLKVSPTLTYEQLGMWIGGSVLLALCWPAHRWRRRIKEKRNRRAVRRGITARDSGAGARNYKSRRSQW